MQSLAALADERPPVLVVDDEEGIRNSLELLLRHSYRIDTAENGMQALELLQGTEYDLVVLDLQMPGLHGTDVLREIKRRWRDTEVLIISGYETKEHLQKCIRYGAGDFLEKPFNVAEVHSTIKKLMSHRKQNLMTKTVMLGFENMGLKDNLQFMKNEDPDRPMEDRIHIPPNWLMIEDDEKDVNKYLEFAQVLARTIESADPYTHKHSDRVAHYSNLIAMELRLSTEELTDLQIGTFLHDIGKIGIDKKILQKEGPLTVEELTMVRNHPHLGSRLVGPLDISPMIKVIIRHHHERFDGKGYPDGLAGEAIPLSARIVMIADAYDAMISDRPYRRALSSKDALQELRRCAGSQFDPLLVDLFLEILGRESSGRPACLTII